MIDKTIHEVLIFAYQNLLMVSFLCISIVAVIAIEFLYVIDPLGLDITTAVNYINHSNASIVDIRSKNKFDNYHIVNSINELGEFEQIKRKFAKLKRPVLLVCDDGRYSKALARKLVAFVDAKYLCHGIKGWQEAGLPVIKYN